MADLHTQLMNVTTPLDKVRELLRAIAAHHAAHGTHSPHAAGLMSFFACVSNFVAVLEKADVARLSSVQDRALQHHLGELHGCVTRILETLRKRHARLGGRASRLAQALRLTDGLSGVDFQACECSAIIDRVTYIIAGPAR